MILRLLRSVSIVILAATIGCVSSIMIVVQAGAAQDPESTPTLNDSPVQMLLRGDGQNDGERVHLDISPGESHTSNVLIGNMAPEPLKVFTYISNITTKINGGMQIGALDEELREPAMWMSYPTEEFEISSGMEMSKEYTISVPDGTSPGEYVIPVAVETVDSYAIGGSSSIRQKVRKVMTIYVQVPGEIPTSFEFGEAKIEYAEQGIPAVIVPLTNTGRTTLRMLGEMVLSDPSGTVIMQESLVLGTVYGGHETIVRSWVPPTLPPGDYTLSLSLTDDVTGFANKLENVTVVMPEPPEEAEQVPLEFSNVLIAPNADPIQFASIVVEITNTAQVQRSTRLTLVVEKDGEHLEDFVVAENLLLEQGMTTVSQRYLPITGWESGSYTFSLKLESVDGSGNTSQLLNEEDVATLDVP